MMVTERRPGAHGSNLRVVCGIGPSLEFAHPRHVYRPGTLPDAVHALDALEAHARDGAWIAGYMTYEFGAALHGVAVDDARPLFALGAFDAPGSARRDAGDHALLAPLVATISRVQYDDAIATIRHAIYDGDVYQVNYTVPFGCALRGDAETLWRDIGAQTHALYQAYVEDGDTRILSWSPELFLRFQGTRVQTRPMKGTAPLDAIERLRSEKNRAEHVMIVDLLRNDLHRICDAVDVEALCTIERYPSFATMTSTIAGTLREGTSLVDVLAATFPCGSVTGAPKRAAIHQIAALEAQPRGAYCGTIGYLSPHRRGWWNVAIRTAQLGREGNGRFDVGGGIVIDSLADDEWNEILVKSHFLRAHAEQPDLLETFACNAAAGVRDAHLARLRASAQALGYPYDEKRITAALGACGTDAQLVRLRLRHDGSVTVRRDPLARAEAPVRICIASERVHSGDPMLRIKSAWRPHHDAAAAQATERGCFEALLRNERDELTEGSRTNIFVEIDGTLYTPPLQSGVLPGILRSHLVTISRATPRVLHPDDLVRADAIYIGNSARGLLRAKVILDEHERHDLPLRHRA